MHGVAPGAQVRFVSFQNDEFVALPDDDSVGHAPAIEHLNPLVPIAFSGTSGLGISSNPTALLQLPSRAQVVDALKQAGSSASDRTIWVFPAGNSGLAIPSGTASYPIYIPELRESCSGSGCAGRKMGRFGVIPTAAAPPLPIAL